MRIFFLIPLVLVSFLACKTTQQTTQKRPSNEPKGPNGAVLSAIDIQVRQAYVDASTQMIRGDYLKAGELFEQVLALDPDNHAAEFNLAKLAVAQRDYEQAIRYGSQALEGDQENYWYYQVLQQAYEEKGDYAKAIDLLEQITRKFPDRLNEKVHLSELYFKNSQVAEAIQELDAIEAKVGFHAETALRKLSLLQQNGDYETALQVANKLIQNEPTNAQYYQIQYDLLQLTGRQDESVKTLENLLQYDPENGFALLSLADYYKTQGNREKSDSYLFQAFENPNVEVKDKVYIVDGLIEFVPGQTGNGQRVKKLGEILYRVHPEEASVQAVRGKLFALDSQLDSARHYLRLALEQDPSNTQAWQDLLQVDFEAQAFNHLFKDAEEALELFPNQEMFLFYFGLAARQEKNYDAAVYALQKIQKRGNASPKISLSSQAELGLTYLAREEFEKAKEWLEKAVNASQAPLPQWLEGLGDAFFKTGNRDAAIANWEKARELGAESLDIEKKLKEL